MKQDDFLNLQPGDIVRHYRDKGHAYIVHANYGSRVTAVRTADMTNPREWELLKKFNHELVDAQIKGQMMTIDEVYSELNLNSGLYEDRVPIEGFKMPEIGARFRIAKEMLLGSVLPVIFPVGTEGEVICIREPLKPCGGYVGCGIVLHDDRFKKIYMGGMIVPWDEISDLEKFIFDHKQ